MSDEPTYLFSRDRGSKLILVKLSLAKRDLLVCPEDFWDDQLAAAGISFQEYPSNFRGIRTEPNLLGLRFGSLK